MQIIHEEPELTAPFEIKTDPRRIRSGNKERINGIMAALVLLPVTILGVVWILF